MDAFVRPHLAAIYGRRGPRVRHPYPRALFKRHPIFPLFVLDTGAFLLCVDRFGAADGETLGRALVDGSLFRPWTRDGVFDWDLHHKLTRRSSMRNAAEMQAWINRLYFLLPAAQQFLRTGDEAHARRWYGLFTAWQDAHPYAEQKVRNFYKESDLVWFDMQVCWRTLVLIHSAYLLGRSSYLTRPRWQRIYAAIEFGAGLLLKEGARALAAGHGRGNHFLQKGTALLYAGLCFPEFESARACVKTGRAILERMMRSDVFPDGGSVEASPSYSHFIARQFLDACVLLEKNGQPEIPGLRGCVRKQYAWMNQMASPARRTLPFNDSCAMDVDGDLAIAERLLPLRLKKPRRSRFFPSSRAGKLGHGPFELYFDAMPQANFWHDHHGRPNILLYCEGRPLLVDAGAVNYDHFLREEYLTRSRAHNVVEVHAKPEFTIGEEWTQPFPEVLVTRFSPGRARSEVAFVHRFAWPERRLAYTWTRRIVLTARSVRIEDALRSARAISATQRFHFAPLNMQAAPDGARATIFFHDRDVVFAKTKGDASGPLRLAHGPAFDDENRATYAPNLAASARGTRLRFAVELSF
ncbi:MAG: heparinase II/III family protein [Planctomycetota bacterium]|nr:heparinase II/III family protein [Planctomycetota bacterium]